MRRSSRVTVHPTLETMARIYSLPRGGGARSPRFASYVALVEHHWGLSSFNPMAGNAAAATVDALIALDAEDVAAEAADEILARCQWTDPVTLAVVVASPGMWTDRLATEVRHRTVADRRANHGEIHLWSVDETSVDVIRVESAAETVRTIWTTVHGPTRTLGDVLAREGLAYALARPADDGSLIDARVAEAIDILGNTDSLGDIIAVLYGDAAASALGYSTLNLPEHAGSAWAIKRAADLIARIGADKALRAGSTLIFRTS